MAAPELSTYWSEPSQSPYAQENTGQDMRFLESKERYFERSFHVYRLKARKTGREKTSKSFSDLILFSTDHFI